MGRIDRGNVRTIADRLRSRNLKAELQGEARTYASILRGSAGQIAPETREVIATFIERQIMHHKGRRPLTWYQKANTAFRWWAIRDRVLRWECVYRDRYQLPSEGLRRRRARKSPEKRASPSRRSASTPEQRSQKCWGLKGTTFAERNLNITLVTQSCEEVVSMRILRAPEVIRRVGYCRMHLWRLEKDGLFPRRVRLSPNGAVGWIEEEVEAWIKARMTERDATPGDEQAA